MEIVIKSKRSTNNQNCTSITTNNAQHTDMYFNGAFKWVMRRSHEALAWDMRNVGWTSPQNLNLDRSSLTRLAITLAEYPVFGCNPYFIVLIVMYKCDCGEENLLRFHSITILLNPTTTSAMVNTKQERISQVETATVIIDKYSEASVRNLLFRRLHQKTWKHHIGKKDN